MAGCWLYMLRCADGSYYVGSSRADDLDTRISQHNQGTFPGYTARRRPVTLVYSAHFDSITDAVVSERQVKGCRAPRKRRSCAAISTSCLTSQGAGNAQRGSHPRPHPEGSRRLRLEGSWVHATEMEAHLPGGEAARRVGSRFSNIPLAGPGEM
jgi:putative endonuclease